MVLISEMWSWGILQDTFVDAFRMFLDTMTESLKVGEDLRWKPPRRPARTYDPHHSEPLKLPKAWS